MFIFKKIVAPLFLPMSLYLIISLTGISLLWFSKRQKTGKLLVTAGAALLLLLLSYDGVSNKFIAPLSIYPLCTVPPSETGGS